MTNETIRPGDLVIVVKPTVCCGVGKSIGKIFSVKTVKNGKARCLHCKRKWESLQMAFCGGGQATDLNRLKKLNPPNNKQETTEKEKEMA